MLPASESPLAHPTNTHRFQDSKLQLSFDIPFFLNVRENYDFIGREYPPDNLKQEIEKAKIGRISLYPMVPEVREKHKLH